MKKEELKKCLENYQDNTEGLKNYLEAEMDEAQSKLKDAQNESDKTQLNNRYLDFRKIHDWILEKEDKDENREFRSNKIQVLLNEYQACHRNRNHYGSVRWTRGSILIATSLGLLGFSFWSEVKGDIWKINFMALFSILLFLLWYLYNQYVNPFIMLSILRMHEIELALYKMGFNIKLHKSIYKETKDRRLIPFSKIKFKAIHITSLEFIIIFGAWSLRNVLLWIYHDIECTRIIARNITIAIIICMIISMLMHKYRYNRTNWRTKIDAIIKKR